MMTFRLTAFVNPSWKRKVTPFRFGLSLASSTIAASTLRFLRWRPRRMKLKPPPDAGAFTGCTREGEREVRGERKKKNKLSKRVWSMEETFLYTYLGATTFRI